MPRFAGPIPSPAAKRAPSSKSPAPQPHRAGSQRSAVWHAIQLKAAQKAGPASGTSSRSALPAPLKEGVEALSGIAMDDVRVHRNSAEPAKLGALAYAQGSDIHLGPGQERHLPHEAWHVVQQKQGRVAATVQLERGPGVNDDAGLEREADRMGAEALRTPAPPAPRPIQRLRHQAGEDGPFQLLLDPEVYPTHYVGPLTNQYRGAVGQVVATLNHNVDAAYRQSLQWQTLANHDAPHVRRWHEVAASYAANPDQEPRIISARFGYSIETIACAGLNNSTQQGLTIETQVAHGHTRPDVVLSAGNQEIAWIDITSTGSAGHILGKQGAGWANLPFVYELVYPQLELRALLNATNDPYYAEVGGLLAGERQIELNVKDANAKRVRDLLIKLRDDNGWTTGTGNAGEKRKATRDFFHFEAATEGVEEETESMKHTRGALEELGINPGPYGFNRGNIGSTNRRVNELISELSREEIGHRQGLLHAEAGGRILEELQNSRLPEWLLDLLHENYTADPTARGVALAAMALKGLNEEMPTLIATDARVQAMNQQDNRVRALALDVGRIMRGPAPLDAQVILAMREQVAPLTDRSLVLAEVDQAIRALHQYAQERNMVFFGRPLAMTAFLNALDVDPPDVAAARLAMQWLHQQRLNEAMFRQQQESQRLGQAHNAILGLNAGDQRVRQLEQDVRNHRLGQPPADIAAINLWIAQAQALDQRRVDLARVLQATAALQHFAAQRGMTFFTRPRFVTNWLVGLTLEPPDVGLAQQVTEWIAEQQQQQQPQQQPRPMEH